MIYIVLPTVYIDSVKFVLYIIIQIYVHIYTFYCI